MSRARSNGTAVLYRHTGQQGFEGSILGRVVGIMRCLLDRPSALPERVLKEHDLTLTLHAHELNALWFWHEPVKAFLAIDDLYRKFRNAAEKARTSTTWREVAMAHNGMRERLRREDIRAFAAIPWRSLEQGLVAMRDAFEQPPSAAAIEHVGRLMLSQLPVSEGGREADLRAFQAETLTSQLPAWLDELGWKSMVETARQRDAALQAVAAGKAEFEGTDIVAVAWGIAA